MHAEWKPETLRWTRKPESCVVAPDRIEIITQPHTDLWQRTYYRFRNDSAPVLQMESGEQYFSFAVRTEFAGKRRFDQCGIAAYLDSENWLKVSVEYEDGLVQRLGAVVTNGGYSDWSSTDISGSVTSMWFRLSRRESDFCIENSADGMDWHQMRICHLSRAAKTVSFGIYACSPEDSSFRAVFTGMALTRCKWPAHDGQPPDREQ